MEQPTLQELIERIRERKQEIHECDHQIRGLHYRRESAAYDLAEVRRRIRELLGMDDSTEKLIQGLDG